DADVGVRGLGGRERLTTPQPEPVETPDHERTRSARLLDELELAPAGAECVDARGELDPRQRRADADVDAAAEPDVLIGVRPGDVEGIGIVEDARVAVRRAEQQRDLRAARDRLAADGD